MDWVLQETSRRLEQDRAVLAQALVHLHFERQPQLARRTSVAEQAEFLVDARYHLWYLSQALKAEDPGFFVEYLAWIKGVLAERGLWREDLAVQLDLMAGLLREKLPADLSESTTRYINAALEQLLLSRRPGCAGGQPGVSQTQNRLGSR